MNNFESTSNFSDSHETFIYYSMTVSSTSANYYYL